MRIRLRSAGALLTLVCAATSVSSSNAGVPIPTPRPERDAGAAGADVTRSLNAGTPFTLSDAVFLGIRNNRSIKSAYIDRALQKFDLRVAEDRFTPQFSVDGAIARQRIGNVDTTSVDISPGVNLRTKTGATFEFGWDTAATSSEGRRAGSTALQLDIEQPLLRGSGTDVNMAPVRQARLEEAANQLRLKAVVAETIAQIIFAYRSLLSAQEELSLATESVERGEELLVVNRALISAGRLAAADIVQTEADIAGQKLRVVQSRNQVEIARLNLLNLLGLDLSTRMYARDNSTPRKIDVDARKLTELALLKRPDYQGQLSVIEQTRLGIIVAKNEQLWDVDLFAQGRLGTEFASGASTDTVGQIIGGVRFSIPVRDLPRQRELVSADTSYEGARLQLSTIAAGVETQIREASSEIDLLWQQIALAEQSRDLASRAVAIERIKLNAGRSTTFQVRVLESNLRASDSQLLSIKIGYLNALTTLDLQLGTTTDTWRVELRP